MVATTPQIAELVARAQAAERLGRAADAEILWNELVLHSPGHPKALWRQAKLRIEARDPQAAFSLLERAAALDATDPELALAKALALRMIGDVAGALQAIDAALVIDPYHFLALLSKAALVEKSGHLKSAARIYKDALKIAPATERLPPALASAVAHAKEIVASNSKATAEYLRKTTEPLRARFAGEDLSRFDECLEIYAGTKKAYTHEPLLLNFPKLPALTFYDRSYFPWLPKLEAATDTFHDELELVLRQDWERFAPYIQYPPGAPVNQWAALNHSPDWSTFFLWKDGVRNEENCSRCPRSAAVLAELPLAHQAGYGPTAMFSVLQAKKAIPAHTGSTNIRLICHLPLILPPNCRFRVGNDMREWKMGEAFIFDDSVEHEAWNDSDQVRVVLIFDVWNPLLSHAERELLAAMMAARNAFNARP
jgi:aspartyl/asparaginyl beta-hydroxylase (cupin superfamily)